MDIESRPNSSSRNLTLIATVVVIAILYFGRIVLIPMALSILITFLLTPLYLRLRHWHFGKLPSVIAVATIASLSVLIVAGLMMVQIADLAQNIPEYRQSIREKIREVRASSSGVIEQMTGAVQEFIDELKPANATEPKPGEEKPVPVEIRQAPFSPVELIGGVAGSVIHLLISAGIVIVFVLFMLFQREDLRDRFLRLAGTGRLNVTTKAIDDAAHRVSRFLLVQLAVNAMFGFLSGISLWLIGVPNPVLWGVLAGLLRYVPYLGIWIASVLPALIALAIYPGWLRPVEVMVAFLVIDIFIGSIVEPLMYGKSTGISPVGVLAAAVFWTWLWGPIGLLLSTPLTVCLVVIGRYVPSLEFLSVLFGDEPVLSMEKRFYQRLLARDAEEATDVAEEFLKEKSLEEFYDDVVIPALTLAEQDQHRGRLDERQQQFVSENARLIIQDVAERAEEIAANGRKPGESREDASALRCELADGSNACVLTIPGRDAADELGALMLSLLLNRRGIATKALSAHALASERIDEIDRDKTRIVCVCAVPPFGYMHVRYICKRLRSQYPDLKIIAAVFEPGDAVELRRREPPIPADDIATSLKEAVAEVVSILPAAKESSEQTAFSS